MRSIVITGFPRQGRYLAQLLSGHAPEVRAAYFSDGRTAVLNAALHSLRADAALAFGGPWPKELVERICGIRKRPAIVLWAGSDVLRIAGEPRELERLRLLKLVHWACAEHLVAELREIGIEARYVPVASAGVPAQIAAMPSRFTVLTYLPEPRRSFYGRSAVWNIAREMHRVPFVVCGPGEPDLEAPPNVTHVGEVADMNALLDASSVLLRLPEHDGLSLNVVEALARGRHVIWTHSLPGVTRVSSHTDATAALATLFDAHVRGSLDVNYDGVQYAAAHHEPGAVARSIIDAIDREVAAERSASGEEPARRLKLAISGHEILAARVATNSTRYSKRLSGSVLSARTHSETAISALKLLGSDAWYTIGQPDPPRAFEIAARLTKKQRIVHWLGSDIDVLAANAWRLRQYRSKCYRHIAHSDEVARRLRDLGLQSSVIPLAAALPVRQIRPLPKTFTLLLYLPAERPEFYGRYQFERLMRDLSADDVRYIIFGGGRIDVPAAVSAERLAWRSDLGTIYDRSTALACFMRPNAVSMMPIDALSHGRYVLCSNEFPYSVRVRDSHELEEAVRRLLRQHAEGRLTARYDAARRIADMYSPRRSLTMLADVAAMKARP